MAPKAIGPQFTLVDVGVAGCAIGIHLGELQPLMAGRTFYCLVLPGQCEAGRLMLEGRVLTHLP